MYILFYVILTTIAITTLYFLLIMPRILRKPDDKPLRNTLYTHRGLYNNEPDKEGIIRPENSMSAFIKAIESGYGIEFDVRITKDKVPIVFHDATLSRLCGAEGNVSDYTFKELRTLSLCIGKNPSNGAPSSMEKIPSLSEVLERVNGKVPLIIEYKVDTSDLTICSVTDELLRNYRGVYCVESFDPRVVFWYRRNRKDVIRGQLADCFGKDEKKNRILSFFLQNLLFNWLTKPDFVAYNHKYPYLFSRRICHKLFRCMAVAWTIKSEEELEEARKHFDLYIFDSFVPVHGSKGYSELNKTMKKGD